MRYLKILTIMLFSPLIGASELLPDTKITVFTTQFYPIQYVELANTIYFLDAVENLEEETSALLSKEPRIAENQAKTWLQSNAGKKFEQKLQQAYVGVTEGWKLGVMKIPAIVFQPLNGESAVIYGQTNLIQAINTYKASKE